MKNEWKDILLNNVKLCSKKRNQYTHDAGHPHNCPKNKRSRSSFGADA